MSRNRLPHWQQDGVTYFVTFRLADSIPALRLSQWSNERAAWLRLHPKPWAAEVENEYFRRFAHTVERWLDESNGECVLRQPRPRRIMATALAHFEAKRHRHHCWAIMPNHMHTLFSLLGEYTLEDLLQSWKGFTSREVNRLLTRDGALWQKDYFDRLIRNEAHFWSCARYIQRNPEKARLEAGDYILFESDDVRDILDGEAAFQRPPTAERQMGGWKATPPL